MAYLTINGHSLCTAQKTTVGWRLWFLGLRLALWSVGIRCQNVVWSFDDFYREETNSLKLLWAHGFTDIVLLYCPGLLGRENAGAELRNPKAVCAIGTPDELRRAAEDFPGLRIGLHTILHDDFRDQPLPVLLTDLRLSQSFHKDLFGKKANFFAFPFGRARSDHIHAACAEVSTVYLSDNRFAYTTDRTHGLINRIHLELGDSIAKFVLKMILSRLRGSFSRDRARPEMGNEGAPC